MDEFERRLRADAAKLTAEVDEMLGKRIDAALAATERAPQRPKPTGASRWWLSALTGAAIAVTAIIVLNLRADRVLAPAEPGLGHIVPSLVERGYRLPLNVQSAVLTEPLHEELEHLRSDFDRVREEVERDFRESF